MQMSFVLGGHQDLAWVRDRLRVRFDGADFALVRTPVGQLVKSLISGRTRDEISSRAYGWLVERYPRWADLAAARPEDVEAVIRDVTFPDLKARHLGEALRIIARCRPDYDLGFLGHLVVPQALAWLERLPGLGRKVAAATLNFSTLHMPAFVVDTHILRVLRRLRRGR